MGLAEGDSLRLLPNPLRNGGLLPAITRGYPKLLMNVSMPHFVKGDRIRARLRRRSKPLRQKFQRSTAAFRGRPEFIIVGAAKCGTTSLFKYLAQHPRLAAAHEKEVRFFDRRYSRGTRWYQSHFSFAWHDHARFEASPSYMFFPGVSTRIAQLIPDARIVVLLRDPVERAWSHFQHNVRRGTRESRTFEVAIEADVEAWHERGFPQRYLPEESHYSYFRRGVYVDQIEPYIRQFGDERVLVLRSEDMFEDPQHTVNHVCEFLGVEHFQLSDARARNVGSSKQAVPLGSELQHLYSPHNKRLYEMLGSPPWWTYPVDVQELAGKVVGVTQIKT